MPFSISGSSFFNGPKPLTNSGNPFELFSKASATQAAAPNLFGTIQAVRQNELDRQVKQAAVSKMLLEIQNLPYEQNKLAAEADALRAAPPTGFVRVGTELKADPQYIGPVDRAKLDDLAYKRANSDGLTTGQRTKRDEATKELFQTVEKNKVDRAMIDAALKGREKIPSGQIGKAIIGTKKFFGSKDPMLQDVQEMKMILSLAQLDLVQYTKGAISNAEMQLFKDAAANNDFNNPGIVPVLQKYRAALDANEKALKMSYKKNYKEDPDTFLNESNNDVSSMSDEELRQIAGQQ